MRRSTSLFAASVALSLLSDGLAYPSPQPAPAGQTISLRRRAVDRANDDSGAWAKNYRDGLAAKYGSRSSITKRGTGTNLLINDGADSSYIGSLAIGTPPVAFDVILDTGSADLWVADSSCTVGCASITKFDSSSSSTFVNESTPFQITYGSGQAAGVLAQDLVQMAGFSVANQTFAVCDSVSSGLLNSPVSGLMGLAFETIASSHATPFWQTLAESGAWDQPLMSFQFTRFNNASNVKDLEPGGTFTMGFVNSSLYTGDIDYQNIPNGEESYWVLPITGLTVQGASVNLSSGSASYAAIDTGTTLVGGPSDAISALYAQIPGSTAGTGNYEGYYFYPCETEVNVTLSFGGQSWSISPADFQLAGTSPSQCMGAFFETGSSGTAPPWIVGDTFLKNVYSVFRYNPASVGFAALSETAMALSNTDGVVPTPTLGSAASVTATGGSADNSINGARFTIAPVQQPILAFSLVTVAIVLSTLF